MSDVPTYNNITPIRQGSTLDFDNLGLFSGGSKKTATSSPSGSSSGRGFKQGNHRTSIITKENITITTSKGNICDEPVDGIVNSVGGDFDLSKGAVAKAILQKAGQEIQKEESKNRPPNVHYGDVVVTKGYNLKAKWVFHGSLKSWSGGQDDAELILRDFIKKVLIEAAKKNLTSVAFPAIGTGNLSFPAAVVASCLFETVDNFSSKNRGTSISEVRCIIYDQDFQTFAAFEQKIKDVIQQGACAGSDNDSTASSDDDVVQDISEDMINNLQLFVKEKKQEINDLGIKVPDNWTPSDPHDPYRRIPLKPSDSEYRTVAQNVRATCQSSMSTILKIERVENYMLLQQFLITKNHISMTCGQGVKVERTLWHGTCKDALNNIYAGGFNRSYCGKNATFYGKGVYFARDFSYSAQVTYSPADDTGNRYIFQCRVLTGQFTTGTPPMIEPPIRTGKIRFDSVTNDPNDAAIFVVFRDTHAYPEYLVTFK